jgi:hypothetical protein
MRRKTAPGFHKLKGTQGDEAAHREMKQHNGIFGIRLSESYLAKS